LAARTGSLEAVCGLDRRVGYRVGRINWIAPAGHGYELPDRPSIRKETPSKLHRF
jgi:hypothetical protein